MNEMDGVILRPLAAEDVTAVLGIETACFTTPWSRRAFESLVRARDRDAAVAVETSSGACVGYAVWWCVDDECELANLAVAPDWRARGVGGALVDHVLDVASSSGARAVYLEVRMSNRVALDLYGRRGFEAVGRRPGYYRRPVEDALVLRLPLGGRASAESPGTG